MIVLAIDPAGGKHRSSSKTGFALMDVKARDSLLAYGVLTWEQVADRDTRLRLLNQCDLLAIEDQYFNARDPQAAKVTIEAKCKWTVLASDHGIAIKEFIPTEWQANACSGWYRGIRRDELKKLIRFYIESRFRLPGRVTDDGISAIGICSVAVDMIALGRLEV